MTGSVDTDAARTVSAQDLYMGLRNTCIEFRTMSKVMHLRSAVISVPASFLNGVACSVHLCQKPDMQVLRDELLQTFGTK